MENSIQIKAADTLKAAHGPSVTVQFNGDQVIAATASETSAYTNIAIGDSAAAVKYNSVKATSN